MALTFFCPTRYDPRWRFSKAREPKSGVEDPWVTRYRAFLNNRESTDDRDIIIAHDFWSDTWFQPRLEALLLAGADISFCADYFGIPSSAVEAYAKIFYDLEPVFGEGIRSFLANKHAIRGSQDQALKQCAQRYGLDVLRWILGEAIEFSPEQLRKLYKRVEQSLVVRLQQLELVEPGTSKFNDLLKTLAIMVKMQENVARLTGGETHPDTVNTLKKHIMDVQETVLPAELVSRSRAFPPEKDKSSD